MTEKSNRFVFLSRYKYEKNSADGQRTDAKWWMMKVLVMHEKKLVISFSADDTSDKMVSSQTASYHLYKNI